MTNRHKALKDKIFENALNKTVLDFFQLKDSSDSLESWDRIEIGLEGEAAFFEHFAENLPASLKHRLGIYSILVNENTGQIFAVHFGRFTFIFRCDFARNKIENTENFRTGNTLDDLIDIRYLGENWAILNKFIEDERAQIEWSYELTNKVNLNETFGRNKKKNECSTSL